jgi:hypothetical protein
MTEIRAGNRLRHDLFHAAALQVSGGNSSLGASDIRVHEDGRTWMFSRFTRSPSNMTPEKFRVSNVRK